MFCSISFFRMLYISIYLSIYNPVISRCTNFLWQKKAMEYGKDEGIRCKMKKMMIIKCSEQN